MHSNDGVALSDEEDGIHELLVGERLRDDRICAAPLEEGQVGRQRVARHPDDAPGELQVLPHDLHGLRAVHHGHDVVDQHQVEAHRGVALTHPALRRHCHGR